MTQEIITNIITRAKAENMTRGQVMRAAGQCGLGGQDGPRNAILGALGMPQIGDALGTPPRRISYTKNLYRRLSAMKDARRDASADRGE